MSFFDAGTYVLNLEADDGDLTVSDEVTITVNAKPPPSEAGPYLETGVVQDVDNSGWTHRRTHPNLHLDGGRLHAQL